MSTIFAKTIAKAIHTYRQMLRRYLSQVDRVSRLAKLNLKDPSIYESEVALYHTAYAIVKDIEENMEIGDQTYYSYSGIESFCQYLKNYLEKYTVEGDHVVHQAQKASRALVQAIQLCILPANKLDDQSKQKLRKCSEIIAQYGSKEQQELHFNNLEKIRENSEEVYFLIMQHYKEKLHLLQEIV